MKRNHFVTGGTGFVGGALVLELLRKTDDPVYCLVRGYNSIACNRRLKRWLHLTSGFYGEQLSELIETRCFAIKGDLQHIELPESVRNGKVKFDYIWHCAASLKFSDKDRESIDRVNVEGTKELCQLSNSISASNFVYMSTAYVAGKAQGDVFEKVVEIDTPANNFYETSKILAEDHLLRFCKAKLKILRPSIIIGHSGTLAAASNSGLYGFIIDLNIFRRKFGIDRENLLQQTRLKIVSVAEDCINLVPIDHVAKAAICIGLSDSTRTIFHLTNDSSLFVKDGMEVLFDSLNFKKPYYVRNKTKFREIDHVLDRYLGFYSSYLSGNKVFSRSNALSIDGVPDSYPMDKGILGTYVNWYINNLKITRPKLYQEKQGENL